MWEPHQTTAILPAVFVKIYLLIFGSTHNLLLFLRITGVVIQFGVSLFWYQVIKHKFDKKISFLTALIVFHTLPKWIQTPEFANMQIWFLLLTFLCILQYCWKRKFIYCIFAGGFMVLEVLAYPSCVLIFPLFIVFLWQMEKKEKGNVGKGTLSFVSVCIGCAAIFIGYLLAHMSVKEMLTYIGYVFSDAEHSAGILDKLAGYGKEILEILIYVVFYGVIAGALHLVLRKLRCIQSCNIKVFFVLLLAVTLIDQIRLWAFGLVPNVHPQIHYLLLFLIGGVLYKREKQGKEEWKPLFWLGWMSSLIAFIAVLLFTNLDMKASFVHLLPGMLCSFLFWSESENTEAVVQTKSESADGGAQTKRRYIQVLLACWVVVLIGARGYLVRETEGRTQTVFSVKQKALYSAANGVYCSYMVGYQYNADYLFLQENVGQDDKMLYIGHNTLTYLMDEREVCSASTISTPVYDEKYIKYYEINPEKTPDVIVIDRHFWENKPNKVDAVEQWIYENYDWENKIESEFLWIVRAKK